MRLVLQMRIAKARGSKWCVLWRIAQPCRVWRTDIDHSVVNMPAAGRPDFGHPYPFIFGESGGNDFVGVLDITASGDRHGLGHLDYPIGSRDVPSFDPLLPRRRVARIARRCTVLDPASNRCDLLIGERWIVREMPILRVGKPRRHFLGAHHLGDYFCFGSGLRIGDERHRCDLAWPVALLTMILEDREYVLIKRSRKKKYGKHISCLG